MDNFVPSVNSENLFYCRHYLANNLAVEKNFSDDLVNCLNGLSKEGYRVVQCNSNFLRERDFPQGFIDYLRSDVWGEHLTLDVESIVRMEREARFRRLESVLEGEAQVTSQASVPDANLISAVSAG